MLHRHSAGAYVLILLDDSIWVSPPTCAVRPAHHPVESRAFPDLADLKKGAALPCSCPACRHRDPGLCAVCPGTAGHQPLEAAVMGAVWRQSPPPCVPRMVQLMNPATAPATASPSCHGRGFLRRYLCHCAVFHLCGHGPRRSAMAGFCGITFHCVGVAWHRVWECAQRLF
jgi:hypothetical protein